MAKVLISFIGKPESEPRCRKCHTTLACPNQECINPKPAADEDGGYRTATYDFTPEGGAQHTASLFGAALLRHLQSQSDPPRRWLILGTAQSIWDALVEALPEEMRGDAEVCSLRDEIRAAVKAGNVNPDQLKLWEQCLGERLNVECHCELVGSGDREEDQQAMWTAIDEHVMEGDDLVMDVTHAFRSLPILASFMTMFLRWTKHVKTVDLVYGAFGMGLDKKITPVVHLPLCQKLLEASEAVATLRHTGNYVPLAQCLDQLGSADQTGLTASIERTAFLDDIQHLKPAVARKTASCIRVQEAAPASSIVPLLRDALQQAQGRPAERLGRKAKRAMQHHQHMQAIVLLWESIRLAAVELYFPEATWQCYSAREEAEDKLYGRRREDKEGRVLWDYQESPGLNPAAQRSLRLVEYLRNAVVHGAQPDRPAGGQAAWEYDEVQRALRSVEDFECIFKGGYEVLEDLLARSAQEGLDS